MTLYHYTCDHSRASIGDFGVLKTPAALKPATLINALSEDERLQLSLIWVTDLPKPDIKGLGLTSEFLPCQRWIHRYRVTNEMPVRPFADIAYRFSFAAQADLLSGNAKPEHWFVSWKPLPVVYDPIEVAA